MTSTSSIKVLLIDENTIRGAIIETGLREAGIEDVITVSQFGGLVEKIYATDPDVILIDLENANRDVLEQMFQVSRIVKRPIAMFVDQSDTKTMAEAIDAGVGAYIVDGLKKDRVRSVLDMAIVRFRAFDRMQKELIDAKSALAERKIIERAKGILISKKGMSEQDAYAHLRSTAMRTNKKIADVAASLVTAMDLLE